MDLDEGARVTYRWAAEGGRVNFDLHAHGDGKSHGYVKGRGRREGEGNFTALFTGSHGWFWRNRDSGPVTITLQARGEFEELQFVKK